MSLAPLSHHEILQLVEPFTRDGRPVDLVASDRAARRLAFRPRQHAGAAPDGQDLQEDLVLESLGTGTCRLTRTLTHPSGLQASVQAMGMQPATLLAWVDAVPPARHFRSGAGWLLARDYQALGPAQTVLSCGQVRLAADDGGPVPALTLTLEVSRVRGVAADIVLSAPRAPLALPDDLLAVLGWNWTRLVPDRIGAGWKTKLRLRGTPERRTAGAEAALDRAAIHLAQTLAEPPAAFHDRHRRARLGVVLRRAIPLLTPLTLVVVILLLPRFDTSESPGLWLMLYHVPTLLIVLSFCVQELPTLKPPPWPRRSKAPRWEGAGPMVQSSTWKPSSAPTA
jgi:hypothetical protein